MPREIHADIQSITLETIDQAIHDWLSVTVDAHVEHPNGDRAKVPVIMASGERWITGRQRKGMRDSNGVLILPIISIRRTGIEPDPKRSALGIETPNLQISKLISPKTNTLQNLNVSRTPSLKASNPVVYEVTTIPFPDRSVMTYELMIQTQYIVQMNKILEKIFHGLDIHKSFVAPFDNHHRHPPAGEEFEKRKPMNGRYVVGFFEDTASSSDNFEEFTDQERIVKYSTTIRVPSILQLDPEGDKPAIKVERTAFKVGFGDESFYFVDDIDELEKIFGKG